MMTIKDRVRSALQTGIRMVDAWQGARTSKGGRSIRTFQGGKSGPLTADWRTDSAGINQDLRIYLRKMRERSRDMVKNSPFGSRLRKLIKTNVVGSNGVGLQVKPLNPDGTMDKPASDVIEASFKRWARRGSCEVTRSLSWRKFQEVAAVTMAVDGECLVRLVDNFDNQHHLALELIVVDLLDLTLNRTAGNGQNAIVMGKEIDGYGAPVRYHFRGLGIDNRPVTWSYPAKDILHFYDTWFVGQLRGIPELAPIMSSLRQLDAYEDAETIAARVAASKMGIISNTNAPGVEGDYDPETGGRFDEMTAGGIQELQPGQTMTPLDFSHPSTAFSDFVKRLLERLASGLGVSYASFTGDLSSVNYSSIRWGGLDEREYFKCLQQDLVEGLHGPVFSRWLEIQLLGGTLKMANGAALPAAKMDKFDAPIWMPRRWPWVDPEKEVNAAILALNAKLTNRTTVLGELGRDLEENLAQIQADEELAKSYGVDLSQPQAPAPAPAPAAEAATGGKKANAKP